MKKYRGNIIGALISLAIPAIVTPIINFIKKAWHKRRARKKLKNRSQTKKMNFPK